MKKIFITLFFFGSLLLVSCDKEDTGNVSKVTNYPLITVLGDEVIFIPQGGSFVDPGAVATEGSKEIVYTTTVKGNYRDGSTLDTNIVDEYIISYTATNVDGFKASSSRKVIVYKTGNLDKSLEGVYTSTVIRGSAAPSAQYSDMEFVLIWKNSNGTYEMSDGFGGYYNIGRAYGVAYAGRPVIITANNISANDFSIPDFTNKGFGGNIVMSGLNVDPATKKISFTSTWDGSSNGTFKVTLTQVQL
ncbi:BT_2262 family domain-containing protein [Flavobacterium psychrotolerans]|nr:BT_2262 family domain-containing protein [Flavobacterium psychrotolerans]